MGLWRYFPKKPDLEKLSPPAIRAFFKIAGLWRLSTDEQIALLGRPARSTFFKWKKDQTGKLTRDQLDRVSYLLGIFKALEVLYPDEPSANAWIKQPNTAPLFGGQSVFAFILSTGIAGLFQVRRYLDAQHDGWA